jgi:hypothetical protein
MATKRWRVTVDNAIYDVEARASWTSDLHVFVNGDELGRGARWGETSRRITFALGRHLATLVSISYGRSSTHYDLVVDGRSVTTGGQPRPPANPYESLATSSLLFFAVLAILGCVLWFGALPEIRLALEGRDASASVTGGRSSSGRSESYYLRYVFVTANGDIRAVEGRVSYDTYRTVHVGDVIRVVYVPSAPDIQRPTSFDERVALVVLVGMFGAMLPFTVFMVWSAYRHRAIVAALADRAVRTAATVDKVHKEWGGQGTSRVAYRYDDAEGRSHKGCSQRLYTEEALAYAPGSSAWIAYDPNAPGNSAWLGAADPNATVWAGSTS